MFCGKMKAYSRTVPGSAFYFAAKPDPVFKENKKDDGL